MYFNVFPKERTVYQQYYESIDHFKKLKGDIIRLIQLGLACHPKKVNKQTN